MADPCPICRRPVPSPADFDPLQHCPRLMGWPLGPAAEHTIACLAIGITTRDALIAESVAALKQRDELLDRAREVLVDAEAKVTAALDQLNREAAT